MKFSKIDVVGNETEKQQLLAQEITVEKYNGNSRGDDDGWSVTDIVTQFRTTTAASQASLLVSGIGANGVKVNPMPMIYTMPIRLKVLTRQACREDKDGKKIVTDPTSKNQVLSIDKPQEGDVVWIDKGAALTNQVTGQPLSVYERNAKIANGEPLKKYEYVAVDSDGCIDVMLGDAMSMLKKNGTRIAMPEFNLAHSSLKDTDNAQRRRITNWLFEEVGTEPAKPKLTPAQKAAKTRAENKAKKALENDN